MARQPQHAGPNRGCTRFGANVSRNAPVGSRRGVGTALICALAATGCSQVIDSFPQGLGVGAVCSHDDDCHASECIDGLCTLACERPAQCPEGSTCVDSLCARRLRVAAVYDGPVVGDEAWTWSHHQGIVEAAEALGYVAFEDYSESLDVAEVGPQIETSIAAGADVIVASTLSFGSVVSEHAAKHPGVGFLVAAGKTNFVTRNLGTYTASGESALFLGGVVAGSYLRTQPVRRACIIATLPHPGVAMQVNAFALGVRREASDAVVEIRWLGHWFDPGKRDYVSPSSGSPVFLEEWVVEQFMASGCRVLAHLDDTARAVRHVEALNGDMVSIRALDRWGWAKPGSTEGLGTCLGSAYWGYGPFFTDVFDRIHRKQWVGEQVRLFIEADESPVGFEFNPALQGAWLDRTLFRSTVLAYAGEEGAARMFRGPYRTNGQRDPNGDGVPDDEVGPEDDVFRNELGSMCWFVEGVVQKADPEDPASEDVPAHMPDDPNVPPPADHYVESPAFVNAPELRYNCKAFAVSE